MVLSLTSNSARDVALGSSLSSPSVLERAHLLTFAAIGDRDLLAFRFEAGDMHVSHGWPALPWLLREWQQP